ncbi:hypothetical protein [Nocardia blacklockiae]|uniref:hypothetical protein n=1 Tax=Nocardia blacklockiae TaxID=480036 RepID=UPI001E36B239|nr:hypothetical protein [Nocardia blacklockiae]
MPGTVWLRREADGVVTISPAGSPELSDGSLDTLVVEVAGGHLSWRLLAGQQVPFAVLYDPVAAQDWLWAVYGAGVALAVDDGSSGEVTTDPALPELVENARRLGYAHWAARWWPASTIDGIPALDQRLLDQDIAALTDECDLIVDEIEGVPAQGVSPSHDELAVPPVTSRRAEDYALAAGPASADSPAGLVLTTGTAGWDWRYCPPGILDASEYAVSWQLTRDSGSTVLTVHAVAAPHIPATVPAHLHPRAHVTTTTTTADLPLRLSGDTWSATATLDAEDVASVVLYVPGVGRLPVGDVEPSDASSPASGRPAVEGAAERQRVRDFVIGRMRGVAEGADTFGWALRAEVAAAASDEDF